MKAENEIPEFFRKADVATIYKGKGEKCDLTNDRGIFIVTIFRSILMKMIYIDKYDEIDSNMSDSQVGGRKGKNIRNHIWVINGIICDVLSSKSRNPIDVQIFDYRQCFDSLWLEECMNDLYSAGLKDDKFALLYNANSDVKVAVKTPVGKTSRGTITNAITQGDVFGPLLCSNQVDTFGKECLEQHKYTYLYKNEVEIPPLGMVDDLICVSECGFQTSMINSFIKFKTDSKKLQFGVSKCKKMHIGKYCEDFKCQNLMVDSWEEVEVKNDETGITQIEDTFVGEELMEEKDDEKYLGDVISNDGRNLKNIKARIAKGKGIVSKIMTILEGIPFGNHYFEVAIMLRNSLLVSSMLCNSEAWYNVTAAEINLLETVDLQLLRAITRAPKSTPKEMLFLELGCIPFSEMIRQRRLGFLYYILHESPESLVYQFFQTQYKNRTSKDWVTTILKDLDEVKLGVTIEQIKIMKKSTYMRMLKTSIEKKALMELQNRKSNHSKVSHLHHFGIKMQKYLLPNNLKMTQEECQLIFKLRCRVTEVKTNMKGSYENFQCDLCNNEEETQEHVLNCMKIVSMRNEKDVINKLEKIYNGKVREQINVARVFKENMDIRKKILSEMKVR